MEPQDGGGEGRKEETLRPLRCCPHGWLLSPPGTAWHRFDLAPRNHAPSGPVPDDGIARLGVGPNLAGHDLYKASVLPFMGVTMRCTAFLLLPCLLLPSVQADPALAPPQLVATPHNDGTMLAWNIVADEVDAVYLRGFRGADLIWETELDSDARSAVVPSGDDAHTYIVRYESGGRMSPDSNPAFSWPHCWQFVWVSTNPPGAGLVDGCIFPLPP